MAMKYITDLAEGSRIAGVYLCKHKQSAVTKNGKNYISVILQDKTGQLDCKVWDPYSEGIEEFSTLDYVYVMGSVSAFNGQLQGSLRLVRRARENEYIPADYLPVTQKNRKAMYTELMEIKNSIRDPYLAKLLSAFFDDKEFMTVFYGHSAAKSVHHSFVGGLLEHTLAVVRICRFMCAQYPVLRSDLLLTAAMLHDIGKTRELSDFPMNEYTDEGQLIGHIVIGAEMIHEKASAIEGFPPVLERELKHCILAHHGEFEFGSPKKPALIEAYALHLADNMDAKLETFTELIAAAGGKDEWLGFSKLLDSNIRATQSVPNVQEL